MGIRLDLIREYPNAIQTDIKTICNSIRRVCGKNLEAIVLIGSAGSGELSYFRTGKTLEVLSDYEFLVVLKQSNTIQRMRLIDKITDKMQRISERYANPLFHVDVALLNKPGLRSLKKDLWTFELKTNSKILVGDERILDLAPTVTCEEINVRDFSELLIKRIHEILLFIPREFVEKGVIEEKKRNFIFNYALCRNFLVIPSALLPQEGILKPGLRTKCAHVYRNYENLRFSKYLGAEFPRLLKKCLRFKLKPNYETVWNTKGLYLETVNYFMKSFCYILNTAEGKMFETLAKNAFFNEFSFKSKLNCIRKMKNFRIIFRKNLKNRLLLAYISLHLALVNRLRGNYKKSEFYLAKAEDVLRVFSKVKTQGRFVEDWFLLNEKVDSITICLYLLSPSLEKQVLSARKWARG